MCPGVAHTLLGEHNELSLALRLVSLNLGLSFGFGLFESSNFLCNNVNIVSISVLCSGKPGTWQPACVSKAMGANALPCIAHHLWQP